MKTKAKSLLILFLITWVVIAVSTFIDHANNYLFKSYFETGNFQYTKDEYVLKLGKYVLAPFDEEKAKEQISVTKDEIHTYRNYYGSLPEQVENIRSQYNERITQAQDENDSTLKDSLIAERDAKIEDITKNFDNDDYVKEKIIKLKEAAIEEYAQEQKRQRQEFLNEPSIFSYDFVNIATGENYNEGSKQKTDVYNENFKDATKILRVDNTVYIDNYDYSYTGEGLQLNGEVESFEGSIYVPKSAITNNSNIANEYRSYKLAQILFSIVWVLGILAVVVLITVARPSREMMKEFKEISELQKFKEFFNRIPVDVRIVLIIIIATISTALIGSTTNTIQNLYYYGDRLVGITIETIINIVFVFLTINFVLIGLLWTWDSVNTEEKMKQQVKRSMIYRLSDGVHDLFLNRSVGMQAVGILGIAFLSGVGIVGALSGSDLLILYIILFFFIALPAFLFFLRQMGYLNRIMKQTQEMAEGRLTAEIKVKGKSSFSKHAANLNHLREGVRNSMSEQAKSERLKTELITNVSHDLRTPLTSIITYTDLLKNPKLTEDERKQYIDVLDKKSARLKTLIEDLFEVSKMASGNMELTKQRLDLTQLLKQAIGEHEEEFAKLNFEIRTSIPDYPLLAYVDGQKMWRVIDNLIVNALKYSLEGTRIYITLKHNGPIAEFTVKNVSKFELAENVEELTERFKRADASRHTDGSGLGLAIAQSIVDLHNGRLSIDVDGDLFKVTVAIPVE
ncbi:MAG TPA: HAMP domain-containing sensor histidine kinase [Ureibacillus sp.]|nr:HAMP domain-containing sensor histidine kinase [Ureibacillus sp.]